ncbi:MAG: cadmium-translocating P-type ATPase, partial [Vicinamibacteraceae bacterium]|nr:cadmium-translocating P-type ATPase [Vicinamibacteraceae bacterium]
MACSACTLHTETTFRVDGMDCHEEVRLLEKRLARLDGVHGLTADVLSQRMRVAHDAARVAPSAIAAAVADTGMRAWIDEDHREAHEARGADRRLPAVVLSALAVASAAVVHVTGTASWLELPLLVLAVVAGGYHMAPRAWQAVRQLSLDINFLMTIAVAGAVVIGEWFEAATVVCLFAIAQLLEARSLERARHAIRTLMDIAPSEVTLLRGGVPLVVPVEQVAPGEVMLVKPGERLALDGTIEAGDSDVNQAPVTGESLPVPKGPGDTLFAGSINGHGALTVRVTRLVRDSTVARIIHLVERAQSQRAPSQAFVDRFARVYTPAVIAAAIVVAAGPPLVFGGAWSEWGYRALVLLVIACPCALVISTPVSIVSALAAAARRGILFKGGQALERVGSVGAVAFDKTGTLTRGALRVSRVVAAPGRATEDVLRLAAAVESHSEHPIARAIVSAA